MAFVFREERKVFTVNPNKQVGPGTYELSPDKDIKGIKNFVPFGSIQPRQREVKPKEITPGPGSYQIEKVNTAEKVVVSSAAEDIKILEVAKPLSIFKSTTKRFDDPAENTPGPGQYYKQNKLKPKIEQPKAEDQKPKIIEHLIKINKYQSIPSIPSNIHAYGYNQNQKNQLELNQPPVQVLPGDKNKSVGPGQYELTKNPFDRKRGVTWHNSKPERGTELISKNTNSSLGPGSYQIHHSKPVFQYKPSPQFASSTLRTMDQRKGAIANKLIQEKIGMTEGQSRVAVSEKGIQSTHVDSDEQNQYIDESTPGPGSYLATSFTAKNRFSKNTHFGSTSRRFQQIAVKNPIGPGEYNVKQQKRLPVMPKRKVPFGSVHQRFQQQNMPEIIPGPGSYEPRNALEDRLIFKIQRGYRGQFGSTQQRFKQPDDQLSKIGPGTYTYTAQYDVSTGTAPFKSKTDKIQTFDKKDLNPPPGAYQINHYDISRNAIKEEQQDPDLVIKKPGFNTGAQRFKYQVRKQDPFDDDDIIHEIQNRAQQEQKQKKNMVPFNSKQPRLKEPIKQIPGPGVYQAQDKWNKRTFNILFADI